MQIASPVYCSPPMWIIRPFANTTWTWQALLIENEFRFVHYQADQYLSVVLFSATGQPYRARKQFQIDQFPFIYFGR